MLTGPHRSSEPFKLFDEKVKELGDNVKVTVEGYYEEGYGFTG